MHVELLIILTLTAAATFVVVVASVGLVIHKAVNARVLRHRQRLYAHYSEILTRILLAELPELPPGTRSASQFKQYEQLLTPLKEQLAQLPRSRRAFHRRALRQAMVDFARDLTGETATRLVYFFYALDFVDEQIALVRDRRWWIRAQAARDLGLLRTRRALAALTAALEDPHPDVREQAMKSIIMMAGVDSLRTIFRLMHSLSTWTAVELSVVVMQYKDQAVPCLAEGLSAPDESVVLFCIEMLAEIGFVSGVEPLRALAENYPNVSVRAKAIEALGRLGDERAEGLLLHAAAGTNVRLRLKAMEALGRMGVPRSVPVLKRRLLNGAIPEKLVAARALAANGPDGLRVLSEVAAAHPEPVRAVCEQAIEEAEG